VKTLERNGFSLIELMIALGIGAAIVLGIAALLMSAYTQSSLITDAAEAEIEEMRAMNFMQNIFSQAFNVRLHDTGDLQGFAVPDGRIIAFDSDAVWADPRSAFPLAIFWREGQNSTINPLAGLVSQPKPTGIYFQKPAPPIAGARSTWGVIYATLGSGGLPLTVNRADQVFEGFTRLKISNIMTYDRAQAFPKALAPVTSFDLELTFRRFLGRTSTTERSFCPEAFLAACPPNPPYKDIVRFKKITLRNNIIDQSPSGPFGARLYDLIHFFHPLLPAALR
jgi:prepilin-type N-terminal cleavage/methylation domain-containing protein